MMKNVDLDGLDGDFLVRLKRESNTKYEHERFRRNVDDWKMLEQRVSNGDKLTPRRRQR